MGDKSKVHIEIVKSAYWFVEGMSEQGKDGVVMWYGNEQSVKGCGNNKQK